MTCTHCDPNKLKPGAIIPSTRDGSCIYCDSPVIMKSTSKWDSYFLTICKAIASKSPCLSRQIGAILVRDNAIISTGYNGPARGIPHCGRTRLDGGDNELNSEFSIKGWPNVDYDAVCPRKLLSYESGTHMEFCTAQHAEENCISNAARNGVSTLGCTLYLNTLIPCKNCFSTLINAGIVEIVCTDLTQYDKYSEFIISNSNIKVRKRSVWLLILVFV